ncbi:unnamed protein product [Pedinophyceae sp. YPF-701]|nr:unnamed protein product [Pedinophyceae sp. YPF-701]
MLKSPASVNCGGIVGYAYEGGEPCAVCGHRLPDNADNPKPACAFPDEILNTFLFLGSYDHTSRPEVLNILKVSHIISLVPNMQDLYRNTYNYYHVDGGPLTIEAVEKLVALIEKLRRNHAGGAAEPNGGAAPGRHGRAVLVHCMTARSKSPAIVAAYLMRAFGWTVGDAVAFMARKRTSREVALMDEHRALLESWQAHLQQIPDFQPLIPNGPEAYERLQAVGLGWNNGNTYDM